MPRCCSIAALQLFVLATTSKMGYCYMDFGKEIHPRAEIVVWSVLDFTIRKPSHTCTQYAYSLEFKVMSYDASSGCEPRAIFYSLFANFMTHHR